MLFSKLLSTPSTIANVGTFQTEAALLQDAVAVFFKAFGDNATFIEEFNMKPTSCYFANEEKSSSGRDILTKIDEVKIDSFF